MPQREKEARRPISTLLGIAIVTTRYRMQVD